MGSIVASLPNSGSPDSTTVDAMLAAAPHRATRTRTVVHGRTALGIGTGQQDDASLGGDDHVAVAFTGALDNLHQIAREAKEAGSVPFSLTPSDVLAAAFHAFGPGLPRRLRGVFGAVVSDGRHLWCFRDHLGFGTLYYRRDGNGSYAASEVKQVVAGAGLSPEPDLDVLEAIFYEMYDESMPCAVRGVSRLPKASILELTGGSSRLRRYWDPTALLETGRFSRDELKGRFDELMTQAVNRVLTGDDAVSLSGGIDSPAVAAYAAPEHQKMSGRPLRGISVVFPQFPSVDETEYTKLVADALSIPLDLYEQTAKPMDGLAEWVRLADSPVPTISLPQYEEHYRRVRALGYRTLLTGEIAEFVFDLPMFLTPHLFWHGRWRALARLLAGRRARGASWRAIARDLAYPFVPSWVTARRWHHSGAGAPVPDWVDRGRATRAAVNSIVPQARRWSKVQLGPFSGVGLSIEADEICQEITGVRARRPWADVDLWEFFLSLPAEVKFPDTRGKTLVRRLLRGRVPEPILNRRDKTVFDDSVLSNIDYPELRRWLENPPSRVPGVNYDLLWDRLEHETLDLFDFIRAKDLASVHAFLSLW
jgi:asparagine synthase (glutamine-hydrolysing)